MEANVSEQGWREVRDAGLRDWVVLHGGATAVFMTDSMADAAALAGDVARVPGVESAGVVLTVSGRSLSVRLTRDLWLLEAWHVGLAQAVSDVARRAGAVADRSAVQEVQLAIAAKPDSMDIGFWRAVLGYAAASDDNAVDPIGHSSAVWVQELDSEKPLRHAMHLDVSVSRDHVEARVAAAVAAGGRVVDDSQSPAQTILADAAGNKVCVCAWPDGAEGVTVEE